MKTIISALALMLTIAVPCLADDSASSAALTPQEVGNTSMPAGQYLITEQISGKSFSLTVTDKGMMILGSAPAGTRVTVLGPALGAGATAAGATAAGAPAAGVAGIPGVGGLVNTLTGGQGAGGLLKQQGISQLEKLLMK